MGQNIQKPLTTAQSFNLNQEAMNLYIKSLFQATSDMSFHISRVPITIITRSISFNAPFQKKEGKSYVNPAILKCLYHPRFQITIQNLLNLLMKQFSRIQKQKLSFIIPRQTFQNSLLIANFCLYFTNQTLLQKISLMKISTDIHDNTKQLMQSIQAFTKQLDHKIFDKFTKQELVKMTDCFTKFITYSINLHHSMLSRSRTTLDIIDKLSLTIFVFLAKLSLPMKQVQNTEEVHHARIIIGSYFLAYSIQHKIYSIYELANEFLWYQLKLGSNNIQNIKALPSSMFKHLPIVNSIKILHWIVVVLLNSLILVREGDKYLSKMNANRISALLLLNYCIENINQRDKQIQYLLKQLCFQTKVSQIQRAAVSQIAVSYSKIQGVQQQILKNYAKIVEKQFIIKVKNLKQAIKSSQLLQYFNNLKNDQNLILQLQRLQCRYINQVIFYKTQMLYDYSDKALWSQILSQLRPKLLTNMDQLSISSKDLNSQYIK